MARQKSASTKLKEQPKPPSELEETLAHAKKRYGSAFIRKGREVHQPDRIPTGIFVMDYATLGGFSHNRSSMIVGMRHSGKSFLSSKLIGSTQKLYPDQEVLLLDIEGTFEPVFAEALGIDLDRLRVVEADTGEMAVDLVDAILSSAESSMVVIDSLAAMIPCKEAESSAEDAHVGLQSRLISGMVRKVTNILVRERRRNHLVTPIYINQFRCVEKYTLVITKRGKVHIAELVAGDLVLGPKGYVQVLNVLHTKDADGIEVVAGDTKLKMTKTHVHMTRGPYCEPIMRMASSLKEGEYVFVYTGIKNHLGRPIKKIVKIDVIKPVEKMDVVDIEVEGGLFFANGVLTHNSKIGGFQKFGEPLSIPGGKALEYCTSVQVTMKNKENKGKAETGVEMMTTNDHSYSITKNKINNGPRSGEFVLVREDGIIPYLGKGDVDNAPTILTYAKRFGLYTGGGTKQTLEFDDVKLTFGKQDLCIEALREDRELQWQLRNFLIAMEASRQRMPREFCDRILSTPNVT